MATTYAQYNGDGTNRNFAVPFPYLSRDHVVVTVNGTPTPAFTWLTDALIQVTTAPAAGLLVDVRRKTPAGTPVDFEDGSVLAEADLDLIAVYTTYLAEEAVDSSDDSLRKNTVGLFDGRAQRVTNVADGVNPGDVVNKGQLDEVFTGDVSAITVIKNVAVAAKDVAVTSRDTAINRAAAAATEASAAQASAEASLESAVAAELARASLAAVYGSSGYLPPVTYAGGIALTLATQTVQNAGLTYAPLLSALPFTTSGVFEASKFRLIQGVAATDLSADNGADKVNFKLSAVGAVAHSVGWALSHLMVNVMAFGATGNGTTDDLASINAAKAWAVLMGGGTVYFPQPTVAYLVSAPLTVATGVSFKGASAKTQIRKTNAVTAPDGTDCVVYGNGASRFKIEDLEFLGNRVRVSGVISVSSHGVYMTGCSYFDISNVRARECKRGFIYNTCWCCSLNQATAQQCQEYGFTLRNSNTSNVLRNTTAWGTGGGWELLGCVYSKLMGCACDHSDAGNHPSDPFLPTGSGGDYQNPSYIFRISGSQGITIDSPGMENGYSRWLYAEGAQVVINAPYITNIECHAATWSLIHVAGTARSNVLINCPHGFNTAKSMLPVALGRKGIYIENAAKQRVEVCGVIRVDPTFGIFSYPPDGLHFTSQEKVVNYNQYNMAVGNVTSFVKGATEVSAVVQGATFKELDFKAVSANVVNFDQLLPGTGLYRVKATGTYTSSYGPAKLTLVETDGTTTNTLKSWTNSATAISFNEMFPVVVTAGYRLLLRVTTNHTTDVLRLSNLEVTWVPDQ